MFEYDKDDATIIIRCDSSAAAVVDAVVVGAVVVGAVVDVVFAAVVVNAVGFFGFWFFDCCVSTPVP